MFGRKAKPNEPPPSERERRRTTQGPISPAFSYYNNRSADATPRRAESQTKAKATAQNTPVAQQPRWRVGAIPALLLGLVVFVCIVKMLFLGADPKIVMLDKTQLTATYAQPAAAYQAAAQKLLASSLTNRTKLTVNLDGVASALQQKYPELSAVSIALPLIGNRPIVYVQIAQPSAILQSTSGNFALNKSGLILARVANLPPGIPLIVDQSNAKPAPGKQYLPGSTISFMQTLNYQLKAAKLAVSAYVLPQNAPYELDVRLEGKPYVVRCNVVSDATVQSGAIIATVRQLGSAVPSTYLDVRVPGRVYYK